MGNLITDVVSCVLSHA